MALYEGPEIGKRVAHYRRLNGWTMDDLVGQMAHVGRGVIANLESGRKVDLSVSHLIEISRALGVPPVALFLPVETPFERDEEGGWDISIEGLRRAFAGEQAWPRADGEATRAGEIVLNQVSLAGQLSSLAKAINDGVSDLATKAPEALVRGIVREPAELPAIAEGAVTLASKVLAQQITHYRLLRDLMEKLGGRAHEVDPGEMALRMRYGGGDGAPADPAE